MHYVVTPTGIESSRIQSGEPTVMSGIVGNVIKSSIPEVQAGINSAAGKVGQNFSEMGTNLTTSANKVGASLSANAGQIGNSLSATFNGLGSMFNSKPASNLNANGTASTSAKANALTYVTPKAKPAVVPVGSAYIGGFGSSAFAPKPSLSANGSAMAGGTNALGVGALARAPMLVADGAANPQWAISAVPTMTLAQYNQRQQALTQQIATSARAVAAPAVVHSNALQAPTPVQPPQQTYQQAQQDLRNSGMIDSSGMLTGSGGHSMWGSH